MPLTRWRHGPRSTPCSTRTRRSAVIPLVPRTCTKSPSRSFSRLSAQPPRRSPLRRLMWPPRGLPRMRATRMRRTLATRPWPPCTATPWCSAPMPPSFPTCPRRPHPHRLSRCRLRPQLIERTQHLRRCSRVPPYPRCRLRLAKIPSRSPLPTTRGTRACGPPHLRFSRSSSPPWPLPALMPPMSRQSPPRLLLP